MKITALLSLSAALVCGTAQAQPTPMAPMTPMSPMAPATEQIRTYGSATAPFASTITTPSGYDTIYVAGRVASPATPATTTSPAVYGNTEQQVDAILTRIEADLHDQGASLGDVVSMVVYLVGDPALGGRMDFAGMNAAYARRFGPPAQPNRPVRTTVQIVALAGPGLLAEITVIAARPAQARTRPAS